MASVVVSKHVVPVPQVENPAEQPSPQAPAAQVAKPLAVPGQFLAQAPQCLGSVFVSVSQPGTASQSDHPAVQPPVAHLPPTQVGVPFVAEQAFPQAPQWETCALRSVSQPLSLSLSQLPNPVLQSRSHTPLTQPAVPLVELHFLPQPPQLEGSVLALLSQPFAALPSQSNQPASHLSTAQRATG